MTDAAISELAPVVGVRAACAAVGAPHRRTGTGGTGNPRRPCGRRRSHSATGSSPAP
jgi:hypothetical protein